jgi:MinD-like ATPase involved in chromosome partitioning or flagellar assembly
MGDIVTFYSYKGGVGRSMAVANVGVLLSQWGYRIFLVDWDLEAPGLEYFFAPFVPSGEIGKNYGVADILAEMPPALDDELLGVTVPVPGGESRLHLIAAGQRHDPNKYLERVRKFDVPAFYRKEKGGHYLETLPNHWREEFDLVIIDSRTGITDVGGICTVHMPDILVLVMAANEQNLLGTSAVGNRVLQARQRLPFDRLQLLTLPLTSRMETTGGNDQIEQWVRRVRQELGFLFSLWAPRNLDLRTFISRVKLPYVPFFSFGERLPVVEEGTTEPTGLGYAYETLASLLAWRLEYADRAVDDRDAYVRAAKTRAQWTRSRERNLVFLSYSHKDRDWADRLRMHLAALERSATLSVWDDCNISPGGEWMAEIKEALTNASVAVLMISPDYLASEFVLAREVSYLLDRRAREGIIIIPVLVRPCPWYAFDWLREIQMLPRDGKAITEFAEREEDTLLNEVALAVYQAIKRSEMEPPSLGTISKIGNKIDLTRIPTTGMELFGRQEELKLLDDAWLSERINVIALVGRGGTGKTTLIDKWLDLVARDGYRGAARVFGWSFYSQGTAERVISADEFINEALLFFGDLEPSVGSPWGKGERLAALVRAEKSILVLDALESLQSPYQEIADPALRRVVEELARENMGLCVITTREPLLELQEFPDTTIQHSLEQISAEAGRALLRVSGVRGTDAELESVSRPFGNNALAIKLLSNYLRVVPGHRISDAVEMPSSDIPDERGRDARRVIAAFAKRFGDGPEIDALRILSLFDRAATASAIAALRKPPPIPGLTDHVSTMDDSSWLRILDKLRDGGLIAPTSYHKLDEIDTHPLVREHFGEELRRTHPKAWQAGHERLYEHFRALPEKYQPDTLEEMAPLFQAVFHGCQAGRHQEVLSEVYWTRICRHEQFYVTRKLGAPGADLAALAAFFDPPWERPISSITQADQAFVLSQASLNLRALGRLAEAVAPMRTALDLDVATEQWKAAAIRAGNFSELQLILGEVAEAIALAEHCVA